jgi:hypothetical protein
LEDKSTEVKELNATLSRGKKDFKSDAPPFHQLPPRGRPTPTERKGKAGSSPSAAEIEEFRRQHAARVIQRRWRKFHDEEENNLFIQSALRGYLRRDQLLSEGKSGRGSRGNSLDRRDRRHDEKEERYDREYRKDRNERTNAETPFDLNDELHMKSNFRKTENGSHSKSKNKKPNSDDEEQEYYRGRPPSASQPNTKRSSSSRSSMREGFPL